MGFCEQDKMELLEKETLYSNQNIHTKKAFPEVINSRKAF
ncbi:hypothetical protein B835_1807 [Enterococcus mundtii 3F]|nr:hypothetical protein [Enterococcus mundtii 3F]